MMTRQWLLTWACLLPHLVTCQVLQLGASYDLGQHSAIGVLKNGTNLFLAPSDACIVSEPASEGTKRFFFMNGTRSILSGVAMVVGVGGHVPPYELAQTLDTTYRTLTRQSPSSGHPPEQPVVGSLWDTFLSKRTLTWPPTEQCRGRQQLSPAVIHDLMQLPSVVPTPMQPASWLSTYGAFLQRWGTHVLVGQTLGSRVQVWNAGSIGPTLPSNRADWLLQSKTCAQVEGVKPADPDAPPGWSDPACAAVSEGDRRAAMQTATIDSVIILGGNKTTREALQVDGFSMDTMRAFMMSSEDANSSAQPIEHQFEPIWTVLAFALNAVDNCDVLQRLINLETTYKGIMAYGCPYHQSDRYGRLVQEFKPMTSVTTSSNRTKTCCSLVTYGCWASKTGCSYEDDCHVGGAGAVCYCYGSGCIAADAKDDQLDRPGVRSRVQSSQTGSYNEGVNRSCFYDLFSCGCHSTMDVGLWDRWIWSLSDSSLL